MSVGNDGELVSGVSRLNGTAVETERERISTIPQQFLWVKQNDIPKQDNGEMSGIITPERSV